MSESFILAIDQGTSSTTALLLDRSLQVRGRASREFPQHFPASGWVEHDLEEIWASVREASLGALEDAGVSPTAIAAIGLTNQRETTALWEREGGAPVSRAIVWQDRRTAPLCRELEERGLEPLFRERTGLVLDPYFSGTKLRWMLDDVEGARERAERGELAFGTIDSFLVYRLSGGKRHVTDPSNASRTLLFDLRRLDWDDELLEILQVPRKVLPELCASSGVVARTEGVEGLPDGIPIAGMAGDQQAALFGQACFEPGDAKCTYGTGAFLLMHTGAEPIPSRHGLVTSVGWKLADGEVAYVLEGSSFVAGAAVQWLRDGLGLISTSAEVEALASQVETSGGVVFVPALAGLGAPHWRPDARGLITGIERGTTKAHLARATLEGIAFQICELAKAMEADAERPIRSFQVDGGAAANDLLLRIQADLLGQEVVRPAMIETTALGAACLAGLAVGFWESKEEIRERWREDERFAPTIDEEERQARVAAWEAAVAKAG